VRRAQGAFELDPLVAWQADLLAVLFGLRLHQFDETLHQAPVFGLELGFLKLQLQLLHRLGPPSDAGGYLVSRMWTAPTEPGRSQPGGVPMVSVWRYSTRSSVSTPGAEAGVTVSWLLVRLRL